MAKTYHTQADDYRSLKMQVTPPLADGGDPGFNDALQTIMNAVDSLHTKVGDRIADHGDKLGYAHDSYQRRDVDVHGVFEDLMPDS
ncbi:hypothetical protein I2501_05730 [Streptacidiphilus sp. NEAU-YB345]|uniref:Uncharacterized protein n=2 Tax=Streptacidiphilus fuscans TaxID=2789292 RepID=A0A931AZ76_9ACTN|nr:hypothetical protein [Streptacidiphilus fuscans]